VAAGCSAVTARVCVPRIGGGKPVARAERAAKFAMLLLRHDKHRVPGRPFLMLLARVKPLHWSQGLTNLPNW